MQKSANLFLNFFILLAGITVLRSQEISAMIKDSLTKEVIPFANIYLSSGKGILSNEEGVFRIQLNDQISSKDSLSISCIIFCNIVAVTIFLICAYFFKFFFK